MVTMQTFKVPVRQTSYDETVSQTTSLATTQPSAPPPPAAPTLNPKFKFRISVRCTAGFKVPLQRGLHLLEEAIRAKRGDCGQVYNVSSDGKLHPLYVIRDYGGKPPLRAQMGKPGGVSQHLMPYLRRDYAIELRFRGGGEIFMTERYHLAKKPVGSTTSKMDILTLSETMINVVISNKEQVDSIELDDRSRDAPPPFLNGLCGWMLDLWKDIRNGGQESHEDLTSRKFRYIK
jgi:hypothetical protein